MIMKDIKEPEIEDKDAAKLLGLTIKELKQVKDAILMLKQGEGLERASRPISINEALGLGYFDVECAIALSTINAYQKILNSISGKNSTLLSDFSNQVAIASGSRQHIRLSEVLDAIAKISSKTTEKQTDFPTPEHVEAESVG